MNVVEIKDENGNVVGKALSKNAGEMYMQDIKKGTSDDYVYAVTTDGTVVKPQPSVALYAVKPVEPIRTAIALYATKPVTPINDINITYSQLEENISLLKSTISSLKSSWNDGTKRNLSTLENSWVGQDCAEYTSKLRKMDKKVQNTISALELLCNAYEKTRDMLQDNQRNIITSINNMDLKGTMS